MQTGARAAESLSIALFNFPIAFRVVPIAFLFPVARWHPGFRRVDGKCHFYRFLRVLTFTVNTAFLRLYFSDLTDKIPTVKVRFPRLITTYPHRNPVVFRLAVTVKSPILASAVCSIFPKSVSKLSIIAGNRYGLRSKP